MKQLFLSFSSVSLGATVVASILTSMTVTCRTEKLVLTTGVVLGGCTLASGFAGCDNFAWGAVSSLNSQGVVWRQREEILHFPQIIDAEKLLRGFKYYDNFGIVEIY